MALSCPRCNAENPGGFRLCGYCGEPLASGEAAPEVRKVVTLVFADVTGSTAMAERRDAEAVRGVMLGYFEISRRVIAEHGGTIEKFIGDAVMAVFGIPVVREDDALRGVRAAADLRDALAEFSRAQLERTGDALHVRIGVHTGEVVAGDPSGGHAFASGDAVNVAARIEQAAPPGQVLLTASTLGLVRRQVEVEAVAPLTVKGKSAPVPAFRLIAVRRRAAWSDERAASPLLGRSDELARLLGAFQDSGRAQAVEAIAILGAPGSGKSRLIAELVELAGDEPLILRGTCLSYGESATFWPVRELVEQVAGLADSDDVPAVRARIRAVLPHGTPGDRAAELVSAAIGAGEASSASLHETYDAVRRLLESSARGRPLLLVFDDLHWAEPPFLDLVNDLIAHFHGPALVVCAGREELRERIPATTGSGAVIALAPLNDVASAELVASIVGDCGMGAETQARIERAGQGNPLFLVELARKFRDDLAVAGESLRTLSIPLTLQGLLAARLDQLDLAERRAAQRASVLGHLFWVRPLEHLFSNHEAVKPAVDELVRRELLTHDPTTLFGEEGLRFGHVLIREAAYSSLAKKERVDCHERYADWLAASSRERVSEYAEVLGHHFDEAHRLLEELGTDPPRSTQLARRAGKQFAEAGARALARSDERSADHLLARAVSLLAEEGALELRYRQALAVNRNGRVRESIALWQELAGVARSKGDRRIELSAELEWRVAAVYALGESDVDDLRAVASEAIAIFADATDERGLGFAWLVRAWVAIHESAGLDLPAVSSARQAIAHSERSGDEHLRSLAMEAFAIAISVSATPAREAIAEIEHLLRRGVHVCEQADYSLGLLYAERGEFARAHDIVAAAKTRARRRGSDAIAAEGLMSEGLVYLEEGDAEQGARCFREVMAAHGASDYPVGAAYAAVYLALALVRLGDPAGALDAVAVSETLDSSARLNMRSLRACARGLAYAAIADPSAIGFARAGVEHARDYGGQRAIAESKLALAHVARSFGDECEARKHAHGALEAYRSVEHLPGEQRAQRFLAG